MRDRPDTPEISRGMNHAPCTRLVFGTLAAIVLLSACGGNGSGSGVATNDAPPAGAAPASPADLSNGLLLALAVLDQNPDGSPKPLPAQLGILERKGGEWIYRTLDDPDSNVFHKAMAYGPRPGEERILTLGGSRAMLKLWSPDGTSETLWEADFGGRFSRMRDAEAADFDGDGLLDLAIATHDQGVVAVVWAEEGGKYRVQELDREPNTFVHEIEVGDLDGDGVFEIYATPSEPNRVDGTPQPGKVVRYVPKTGEGPTEVAALGDRHAKEILVADVDGDGRDELYVAVEAVSGGKVEIRRYDADTPADQGEVVAEIDDTQTRFLTVGDVDGDGVLEMVAASFKSGLWLLRPSGVPGTRWPATLIDADSSGFEHAAILADLDEDGRDELYVASDDHDEVRRYVYQDGKWHSELLVLHLDGLGRFTWNIMAAPLALLPSSPEPASE
ncbi:MAG TPA: VCBS repeat-containing protein [Thermoanaerobaculia bacterium]|nr:VCBS repeat-containing protein [Thermoanaerobaculia bacterium]